MPCNMFRSFIMTFYNMITKSFTSADKCVGRFHPDHLALTCNLPILDNMFGMFFLLVLKTLNVI